MSRESKGRLKIFLGDKEQTEDDKKLGIEFPLYRNCYKEAFNSILDSIEDISKTEGRQNSEFKYLDKSNIFAFIGPRGIGKTTALNEFNKILCKYAEAWELFLDRNKKEDNCRFYVLPVIDASLLESDESLIELIWSDMYRAFEKKARRTPLAQYEEVKKDIICEFDEVYKNYIRTDEKKEFLGESVAAKLKSVSSSLKARKAFDKLVSNFLALMFNNMDERKKNFFLVISVDDLDLNIEKSYAMLEQLFKYLTNPKVIILVAMDYEQMRLNCERYFLNELTPQKTVELQFISDKASKLCNDYLLKVFPLSNRIYIPDGKKLLKDARVYENNEKEKEIKKFLLYKIAEKTGIYYDALGLKKHFCLPETVRKLVSYNDFLNSLYSLQQMYSSMQTNSFMDLYDENFEMFNNDINVRMAVQVLDKYQLEYFNLIVGRNIERRGEYAVNFLKNWMKEDNEQGKRQNKIRDEAEDEYYCYCDLLKEIYSLGRVNYYDKVMAHCLLASFTSQMVREYYSYRYSDGEREKSFGRLKKLLGHTFGNEWLGENMPMGESILRIVIRKYKMGYIQNGDYKNFNIVHSYTDKNIRNKYDLLINTLMKAVQCLECFSLLISNCKDSEKKAMRPKWEIKLIDEESGEITVSIKSKMENIDFDILGFIGRELIDAKKPEYRVQIKQSLTDAVILCLKEYQVDKKFLDCGDWENDIREKINKNSIWYTWEVSQDQYKVFFPFYNLDMTYNIIKRVRRKARADYSIKDEEIFNYFKTFYGYIAFELKMEDDYYNQGKGPGDDDRTTMYKDFAECPFIQAVGFNYMGVVQDTKLDGDLFQKILYESLQELEPDKDKFDLNDQNI